MKEEEIFCIILDCPSYSLIEGEYMRDINDRISDLQKKQDELKNKERELKAKAVIQERKARTKRLIQIGAAVESVIGKLDPEELKLFVAFLRKQEAYGQYVSKALNRVGT